MARCWTCGSSVSGNHYRCSACEDSLREIESLHETVSEGFADLARIQEAGFNQLSDQLSEIGTILEWGFCELSWRLQQQTEALRSIDHTLKTPSETKANEWRLHAEELRRRGVLEESEEFFLKALNEYRLDYRIYVGLAETYLQINRFDKAKVFLEKSLPHAPKGTIWVSGVSERVRNLLQQGYKIEAIKEYRAETGVGLAEAKEVIDRIGIGQNMGVNVTDIFDWRSYSYRLIGRIYACEENYLQAVVALHTAIGLSPTYEDGHYDYAQYSAQMRNRETSLSSLQKAILTKPLYWYLAQKERNFDPVRSEIEKFISRISMEASNRAKDAIIKAERVINQAREGVSQAKVALSVSRDKAELKSSTICEDAETKLKLAEDKVASGDYIAFLEAKPIADESYTLANSAMGTAYTEREYYQKRRTEKVKNAWARVPGAIFGWPLFFLFSGYFVFGFGGCTVRICQGYKDVMDPINAAYANEAGVGALIGIIGGVLCGIHNILKELE